MRKCKQCGGFLVFLGALGRVLWYKCRDCGWEQANQGFAVRREDAKL